MQWKKKRKSDAMKTSLTRGSGKADLPVAVEEHQMFPRLCSRPTGISIIIIPVPAHESCNSTIAKANRESLGM